MQARETKYHQCNLKREVNGVITIQNSYLPEKFAVKGMFLKLKNSNGEWEDHWEVVGGPSPGEEGRSEKSVNNHSRDYKKTRPASDIPRGKR